MIRGRAQHWKELGLIDIGTRYKIQTRNHLFKECKQWRPQQKKLWEEARRETGRGKNRFRIRDLLADERCTQPILDFLHTTGVGSRMGPRTVPPEPGGEEVEERRSKEETEAEELNDGEE